MKYYRYTGKDDLFLGKYGKSDETLIPNELLTQAEINTIQKKCPKLNIDKVFKIVDLPTNKTYRNFGVRFENGTDHNSKLESKQHRVLLNIKESYSITTISDFINELKSIYNKYFPYGELVILDLDDYINAELYADKNRASDYDDLFDISVKMDFNNKFKSNSAVDDYKIDMSANALTKDVNYPSIKVNNGFDKIALSKTYGDYDTILDEFTGYCQAIKAKMKELRRSKKLPSEFVRIAEINESMKRGKCKMVRKLYIKENAITDLRSYVNKIDLSDIENKQSGWWERKYSSWSRYGRKGEFIPSGKSIKQGLITWLEGTLKSNWDFDFNAEQLELIPVTKPKSSIAAKKNPNLLIGINSKTGDAVIVGKGQFYAYYSGLVNHYSKGDIQSTGVPNDPNPDYEFKNHRASLRDIFEGLDLWLEIIEPEGYQKRSEISNGRQNDLTTFTSDDRKYLEKQIYSFERELYDPEIARRKYAKKLEIVKNRKQYEDTLNSIDDINDRIKSINFGHPIFDDMQFDQRSIDNLKKTYKSLVYHIDGLNNGIEKNDKWDIDYHLRYIPDYLGDLDRMLTDKFGV